MASERSRRGDFHTSIDGKSGAVTCLYVFISRFEIISRILTIVFLLPDNGGCKVVKCKVYSQVTFPSQSVSITLFYFFFLKAVQRFTIFVSYLSLALNTACSVPAPSLPQTQSVNQTM